MITDVCAICLEELTTINYTFITICNHKFHKECINKLIEKKCPCCREELKEKEKKRCIKVTIDRIDNECYEKICKYYNERQKYGRIERLDRLEGGFCVEIKKEERESNLENDRIRQLRWSKRCLVSGGYQTLLYEEIILLFESLNIVLGEVVMLE